ncbi:hypothetical protein C8R45DRAFT_1165475 [Mycena sanguinolenta]|nr:hypothetical protein C8R45DRAFT_1165475 [Mycena sanguinolenta]
MPISFSVASHPAKPVSWTAQKISGLSPEVLLSRACAHQSTPAGEILQSLILTSNGFMNTIISAYNRYHNLIICPDDVWITILTQFNFVNANAELLRASFVAHEGKRTLTVKREGPGWDFAVMARQMMHLLGTVVVDPTLRAQVMPDFSTTSVKDTTVGAIVIMSMLKSYFEYVRSTSISGIPRVALEGTKEDWEAILHRLEKLKEYGIETTAWYHLLVPVISRLVAAFDAPDAASNVEFWQQVAPFKPSGSGASYYSGWITAFCVFNEEGNWIGLPPKQDARFSSLVIRRRTPINFLFPHSTRLTLDDTLFHMVDSNNIPLSYVDVPVVVKNSTEADPEPCTMIAGVIGRLATTESLTVKTARDTVQPVMRWWMFRNK